MASTASISELYEPKRHIYCHIPFCFQRCPFCCYMCSFSPSEICDPNLLPLYIAALTDEIGRSPPSIVPFHSIVFGGGTPTLLNARQIESVLEALADIFKVPSADGVIRSFESSPEMATRKKLESFHGVGFNRISIGAQSLNDSDLHFLGRRTSKDIILSAYVNARSTCFDSINIDLMMGFPGHSISSWQETIREVISLAPDSISINPFLAGMARLDQYVAKQKEAGVTVPIVAEQQAMLEFAFDNLRGAGYENNVNLVFTKQGHEFSYIRDTFSINRSVKAYGAGIKSFEDNTFVLSGTGIRQYIDKPGSGRREFDYKSVFNFFVRNGLIANSRLSNEEFKAGLGISLADGFAENTIASELLRNLLQSDLAAIDDTGVSLNPVNKCQAILYIMGFFDVHWKS